MKYLAQIIVGLCCVVSLAHAQVTYTVMDHADAFLATGSPSNPAGPDLKDSNFGGAGALIVTPASSTNGEFQSILRFDLSGATNVFHSAYGTNWVIRGISLELASNYGTNGAKPNNAIFGTVSIGKFVIEWLADDDWLEGTGTPNLPTMDGVTYDSLANLLASPHEPLCTNTYFPPGNNVHVTWPLPLNPDLVADIVSGGQISFRFYAADDQVTYLFNSYFFGRGNEPLMHVTASPLIKILSGTLTNGTFHLVANGPPDLSFQVQANYDLSTTNWQNLGAASADISGNIQFDDHTASSESQRFYRLSGPD